MYSVTPINTPPVSLPPVMVAMPLPNALGALRVPPTDVAPSFTNEQVRNDSRNTNPAMLRENAAPQPQQTASFTVAPDTSRPSLQTSAQTNFLAQLISQDTSPQAVVYLAQYEKLVAFSNVKYKPSNAGKPEPSGVFAKFLRSDPQPAREIQAPRPQAKPAAASNREIESTPAYDAPEEAPQAQPQYIEPIIYRPDPALQAQRATKAYVTTSARNDVVLQDRAPQDSVPADA